MSTVRPSAVAFFPGDHPQLATTIRAQLERRRAELVEQLLSAQDWPDFTKRRGLVEGIDEALFFAEQAERELNKR